MAVQGMMRWCSCLAVSLLLAGTAAAQDGVERTALRAHALSHEPDPPNEVDPPFTLDGRLDERAWRAADSIVNLVPTEPQEGGPPAGHTSVKVLISPSGI